MLAIVLKLYLMEPLNWSDSTLARDIFACEERLPWRERERLLTQEESSPFPHSQAPSRTIAKLQSQLLAIRSPEQPRRKRELSDSTTTWIEKGWRQPGSSCPIVDPIFLRYPPLPPCTGTHRTQRALPHLIASQSTALHTGRVPLHTLIHREILASSY